MSLEGAIRGLAGLQLRSSGVVALALIVSLTLQLNLLKEILRSERRVCNLIFMSYHTLTVQSWLLQDGSLCFDLLIKLSFANIYDLF